MGISIPTAGVQVHCYIAHPDLTRSGAQPAKAHGPYRNFGSELALVLDRCHVVEEVPQKPDMSTKQMTTDELPQVLLPNGYVFENGTPFYEKIGEKRARELQNALHTKGYKIESIGNLRRANLQDREGPLQAHMRRR